MKPKSYIVQSGCAYCQFVFIKKERDSSNQYYCTRGDNEVRPKCGSVLMGESFLLPMHTPGHGYLSSSYEVEELIVKWEAWVKDREVRACGKCDEYVLKGSNIAKTND